MTEPRNGTLTELFSDWSAYAKELLGLLPTFTGKAIMAPDTAHHTASAKVVAFKFTQAVRTFKAAVLLCERGDGYDAVILSRVLLESLIDAVFLANKPEEVWRYLEEAADWEEKRETTSAKYGPPPGHPWHTPSSRPSSDELRKRFSELAREHSKVKSWRKLSLRARAEGTGEQALLAYYEMLYPLSSSYTHGGSTILMDYLRDLQSTDPRPEFHVAYDSPDSEVASAWLFSTLGFLLFLRFLDALFRLEVDARLTELEKRHQELGMKGRRSFPGVGGEP